MLSRRQALILSLTLLPGCAEKSNKKMILDSFSQGNSCLMANGTMAWTASAIGQKGITAGGTDYTFGSNGFVSGTFDGTQQISEVWPQVGSGAWVQATAANQPTVWPSVRESWPEVRMMSRYGSPSGSSKWLGVSSPPTARSQDWTMVWVQAARQETFVGGEVNILLGYCLHSMSGASFLGNTSTGDVTTGDWGERNRYFRGDGGFDDSNLPALPSLRFTVHAIRHQGSTVSYFVDGIRTDVSSALTATALQPYKIGQLNDFAIFHDQVSWLGTAWFPALTDPQIKEITQLINSQLYGNGVIPNSLFLFVGDSITAGYFVSEGKDRRDLSWPYDLITSFGSSNEPEITSINFGVAGAFLGTTSNAAFNIATNFGGMINSLVGSGDGYTKRVVVISAGTNDIFYGTTSASSILSELQSLYNSALGAGATRVFVLTQIPREQFNASQETERQTLNSGIISTFGKDAIDVASQNWQPGGLSDWTTNYQDGVHPNAAGRQLFIAAAASTLSFVLPLGTTNTQNLNLPINCVVAGNQPEEGRSGNPETLKRIFGES